MREDSLLYFNSPKDLKAFMQELDIYNGWKIRSGLMNDRGKLIEDKPYTKRLRDIFSKKGFFRTKVSIAEIVSWLDTMTIMDRLLIELERRLSNEVYNSLEISVEYMIQMSKKMRIDYMLIYNDRILLLEFRTVNTPDKIRPNWDIKFRELLIYKELMSYYMFNKTFRLYAFIALYEYNNKKISEYNVKYNKNQVTFLATFIEKYLIQ